MRCSLALLLTLALFTAWAAGGGNDKDYRLRRDRVSDGHGNAVYALEFNPGNRGACSDGAGVANYLFVNEKTGERRWLFPEPQGCIWRVLYFAHRPQAMPVEPADVQAVVYDVTPGGELHGDLGTESFRFCTGTNPCLPLRRIFASEPDGRNLTPVTSSFQILDNVTGQAVITQRQNGVIMVSFDDGLPIAAFSIDAARNSPPR